MIVVDVGAMRQGPEESVHKLISRFSPELYFAFDPHPEFEEGVTVVGGALVVSRRAAVWSHTGTIGVLVDGITTGVEPDDGNIEVDCFTLSGLLRALPDGGIVVKLDCEGAEYEILADLADSGEDERLALVIVEWHPPETAHGWYTKRPTLRCPVEEWE